MQSLSIRSKLLAMMLLAGLFCVVVGGFIADRSGGAALRSAIFNQLTSLRENKRSQIEGYLDNQRRAVRLLSQMPTTLRAAAEFSEVFRQMNAAPAAPPAPELVQYYHDDFLPRLARMSDGVPAIESYLPAGSAARQLQLDYIARNPHTDEEKDQLLAAPGGNAYDVLHARLHRVFVAAARQDQFDDVILIDARSGDVVYSVIKQPDFGTNLRTGPYAHSGLARAFEAAVDAHDVGAVVFEMFSFYPPSALTPAAFFAAPIVQDGITIGVIAVQLSINDIDSVMTSAHRWAETGLGRTGSAYLVGADGHARSDDRFLFEDKPAFLDSIAAAGVDRETVARIDATNTMVLYLPVDTEASRTALHGESGTGIIRDYRNKLVLSSWTPMNLGGIHWAVIAEIDADEAFAPQVHFRNVLLLLAAVTAIALTLASLIWANVFVRPIREILAGVKTLGAGDDSVRIPQHGRDEFSELAAAFNTMAETIALRNAHIREKSAEYDGLLKNIYPEMVAERIKLGHTSITEVVRNVSVLVLNLGGANALFESKQCDTVAVMNEIIDAFDDAAERLGIEKLKTVGESYFAACGFTTPRLDHAARAVTFAEEACRILARTCRKWDLPLYLRAGIASGDVEAGLIGRQRTVYDLLGTTVAIARRIASEAGANAICITVATHDLLGDASGFAAMPPIMSTSLGKIVTFERSALAGATPEA